MTSFEISAISCPVNFLEKAFQAFAQFAANLKGDEKSETQTFLFHLLEGFGDKTNTLAGQGGWKLALKPALNSKSS